MNYTLKELTSMSFEDWAALVEIEDMVNRYNYDDVKRQMVAKRESMKYMGTISLSSLFNAQIVNFKIH